MTERVAELDINWLNSALFTSSGFIANGTGSYAALVSGNDIHRIIPRGRDAARASFAKTHDAMGRRRLIAGQVTRGAIAAGLGNVMFRRGFALAPELALGGDSRRSLVARLGQLLPATDLAVTLGPQRHNRKPVLQLIADGVTIAYAKVACDDVTEQLVSSEAPWFGRSNDAQGVLVIPDLIEVFEWNDRTVSVIDAAAVVNHNASALNPARVALLASAIADLGDRRTLSVRHIVSERMNQASAELRTTGNAIADRFGNEHVEVGAWHGDLTPWNTISEDTRTWVLDWEFADEPVPVGADALHHQVMVATHLHGQTNTQALNGVSATAAATLRQVGNTSSTAASWALYLFELARRDERLTSAGVIPTGLGAAALALLTTSLSHNDEPTQTAE